MAFTTPLCNLLRTGRKSPRLRGAFSHLAAHNGGLEKDGGEGMCGPGLCCCVRRGAGPNPQGAQQSRGSARPRRGVAEAVLERGLQGIRRPPGGFISPRKALCREPFSRESGLLALMRARLFCSRGSAFAVSSGFSHLKVSRPPCLF